MKTTPIGLTIAGSDPSGGAGLQADLKTFQECGVYGMSVVTLLTVQNTEGVFGLQMVDEELVRQQIDRVISDIVPSVIKFGALGEASMVRTVAESLGETGLPWVVDPVLVSKHGASLADDAVVDAYRKWILPRTFVLTPNRFEMCRLTDRELMDDQTPSSALEILRDLGCRHVLLKWGKRDGHAVHYWAGPEGIREIQRPFLAGDANHGSGCVLSALVAAGIASSDSPETDISEIIESAIEKTYWCLSHPSDLGKGIHPVDVRHLRKSCGSATDLH